MAVLMIKHLLLVLITISPTVYSIRHILTDDEPPLPFSFIQDSKKGDSIDGLRHLKSYLRQFGYLNYLNQTHYDIDNFDDALESALITYQQNFDITPTGILDQATVANMALPRCGVADFVDGVNTMDKRNHAQSPQSKSFDIVEHYSFIPKNRYENRKWPSNKRHLTYRISPNVPKFANGPIDKAFSSWANVSDFTFEKVSYKSRRYDVSIAFYSRSHGDGNPFDGPGKVHAHAFPPTSGELHFDSDDKWVDGVKKDALDVGTVATHEIGHVLGLGHSKVKKAIMYPYTNNGETRGIAPDDIEGIKALYH